VRAGPGENTPEAGIETGILEKYSQRRKGQNAREGFVPVPEMDLKNKISLLGGMVSCDGKKKEKGNQDNAEIEKEPHLSYGKN